MVSLLSAATALLLMPIARQVTEFATPFSIPHLVAWVIAFVLLENIGLLVARWFSKRWGFFMKLARFTSTGVFNTAFDMSVITTLALIFSIYAGPILALFNVISFSATTVVSYFINRNWSFVSDKEASVREFGGFAGVTVSSMLINTALVYLFTTHVGPPLNITPAQWVVIVKVFGVFFSFAWNFAWLQFVVFRRSLPLPPDGNDAETER